MIDIIVAPQRWLDPSHPDYRPGLSSYEDGGKYLDSQTMADLTGLVMEDAVISVEGPFPRFTVGATTHRIPKGRVVRANLFKQSAGWRWTHASEEVAAVRTLISVESAGRHHYAMRVEFPDGVALARYLNAKCEPRLRPTTKGVIDGMTAGIGWIAVRGKPHPVYEVLVVRTLSS